MTWDTRIVVLEGVARQARGTRPTAKWLRLWATATAAFSPEDARAWCRGQWARLDAGLPVDPAVALASYWGLAALDAPGVATLLADRARRHLTAREGRLAGAAVAALGRLASALAPADADALPDAPSLADDAVRELLGLWGRLRHATVRARVAEALDAAARARGLAVADLEDRLVMDAGLSPDGAREWEALPYRLRLAIAPDGKAELGAVDAASGKAYAGFPERLRQSHYRVLNEARAVQKALQETLGTQKRRLEAAMETGRDWPAPAWRGAFGRHPVLRHFARRLVWGVYRDGKLVDTASVTGSARDGDDDLVDRLGDHVGLPEGSTLRLVHPVELAPATREAWRGVFAANGRSQPFKQLEREVYAPPADEQGALASTRFVGTRADLAQAETLLRARHWRALPQSQGRVYAKTLGALGLTAVVGLDFELDPRAKRGLAAVLGSVEFHRAPGAEAAFRTPGETRARVGDVPPAAYSETMRDLALVAGVGAPPASRRAPRRP